MTAEIAILNRSAVAMAADSAVTIGERKVYNSANKLFTLSKYEPIGIMVYDSAEMVGIPWETIIKEFRSHLGNTRYEYLEEYVNHFWEFVRTQEYIVPASTKDEYIAQQARQHYGTLANELRKAAQERIDVAGHTNLAETKEDLESKIEEHEKIICQHDYLEGLSDRDAETLIEIWRNRWHELASEHVGRAFDLLDSDYQDRLLRVTSQLFIRGFFLLKTSGVVIAGFGSVEIFPRIASYIVEGVFEKKVKKAFVPGKSNIQNDEFTTTIVPFAQDDMIWTFMRGLDPTLGEFANRFLDEVFEGLSSKIDLDSFGVEESIESKFRDHLKATASDLIGEFRARVDEFQSQNNTQPILDMVGVLPKDELAEMAESLVNLTVFKRKVSSSIETVGGPVDVAVISKGDGFIWVKRKHYFQAELNPHFFRNYFGDQK